MYSNITNMVTAATEIDAIKVDKSYKGKMESIMRRSVDCSCESPRLYPRATPSFSPDRRPSIGYDQGL